MSQGAVDTAVVVFGVVVAVAVAVGIVWAYRRQLAPARAPLLRDFVAPPPRVWFCTCGGYGEVAFVLGQPMVVVLEPHRGSALDRHAVSWAE